MTDVLTLRLDDAGQARFEALRQQHFPPERNVIAAHPTLFHTLPRESWVSERLRAVAAAHKRFPVTITGVRSLGNGVAYRLSAAELRALHAALTDHFSEVLTPQDRQRFDAHVVVQNKVTPAAARELLRELEREFVPFTVEAVGLELWHYLGGPWKLAERFDFPMA